MTSGKVYLLHIASGIAALFAITGTPATTYGQMASTPSGQGVRAATPRVSQEASRSTVITDSPKASSEGNDSGSLPSNSSTRTSLPAAPISCTRTINADVVALRQPFMLNRLGAAIPQGVIFALRSDVDMTGSLPQLKPNKRARPIVLRANVGDCLSIKFENTVKQYTGPTPSTPEISLHIQGMHWVNGSQDDGSFDGNNSSSLANAPAQPAPHTQTYTLQAEQEGTFLLYTMGDTSTQG